MHNRHDVRRSQPKREIIIFAKNGSVILHTRVEHSPHLLDHQTHKPSHKPRHKQSTSSARELYTYATLHSPSGLRSSSKAASFAIHLPPRWLAPPLYPPSCACCGWLATPAPTAFFRVVVPPRCLTAAQRWQGQRRRRHLQ